MICEICGCQVRYYEQHTGSKKHQRNLAGTPKKTFNIHEPPSSRGRRLTLYVHNDGTVTKVHRKYRERGREAVIRELEELGQKLLE